ncbi:diguanylate cyclase [Paenibacillus rhizophilus]|uniref:Diguanylate cyclase n=2 Tax=Paenibacillus rhizophilus TaxID=1850366 RepID=A0A3N9P3E7_9BACL|nr:diguanylate cyclase [Paenibacillus rhizophilus]
MPMKRFDGYRSFQYLRQEADYRFYPLAERSDPGKACEETLTEPERRRYEALMSGHPILSLRDHGFTMPKHSEDILAYCRQGYTAFDYEGLALSRLDGLFENFMDGVMNVTSKAGLKWDDVLWNLGIRYCDMAHQDTVRIASSVNDILSAKATGQIAIIPSLEAATALENEIERVDILYGFGIRCMGITYNDANTLGSGLSETHDGGLTRFGRRVVERMNRLRMAIDISHCGDRTSMEVIEASEQPVLITHAGARALWNTPRMKPDEILLACKERGGLIGILAAPNTTMTRNHPHHCLESVMEHFEYVANLVGIDHVAFGPDTFFGDHTALQRAVDNQLSIGASHSGEHFTEADYVRGAENPVEAVPNMIRWLIRHGYTDSDIAKAAGGNILRVLRQLWD